MDLEDFDDVDFEGETRYEIVAQSKLGAEWSVRLGGRTIETRPRTGRAPVTTLVGTVRDQARLRGILDALYGLHLSLLGLELISPERNR